MFICIKIKVVSWKLCADLFLKPLLLRVCLFLCHPCGMVPPYPTGVPGSGARAAEPSLCPPPPRHTHRVLFPFGIMFGSEVLTALFLASVSLGSHSQVQAWLCVLFFKSLLLHHFNGISASGLKKCLAKAPVNYRHSHFWPLPRLS